MSSDGGVAAVLEAVDGIAQDALMGGGAGETCKRGEVALHDVERQAGQFCRAALTPQRIDTTAALTAGRVEQVERLVEQRPQIKKPGGWPGR